MISGINVQLQCSCRAAAVQLQCSCAIAALQLLFSCSMGATAYSIRVLRGAFFTVLCNPF